jgi:hypothetical protein
MKALVTAWVVSLAITGGGLLYLWTLEVPEVKATEADQVVITARDKAPVLSSGPMTFDASQPEAADEDCLSSC